MKHLISLILASLFISTQFYAQNFSLDWVNGAKYKTILGAQNMALSSQNDIYTTGYFQNTVNFESNSTDHILTSNGQRDAFIKKVDNNGNLLWVNQIGGISGDQGHVITIDNDDNIYVIGYFNETVDFDPSSTVYNITSTGADNVFILKLDANGNFLWVKQFSYFHIQPAVVDETNNLYVMGSFSLPLDLDPGTGTEILQPDHVYDYFVQKLDAQGNFVWTSHTPSTSVKTGRSLTIDSSNHLYITGFFEGTIDFDPGSTVSNLTAIGNSTNIFVQKIDIDGNLLWAKHIGNSSNSYGSRIVTDNLNGVYISGTFSDSLQFNSNPDDNIIAPNGISSYILKLNSDGNFQWAVSLPTPYDYRITSLQTDQLGSVYLSGYMEGVEVDFDPGPMENNLSVTNADMFVHKFNSEGEYTWAFRIGDSENGWDASFSSIIGPNGEYYSEMLAGAGGDTIDFAPGPTVHNVSTTNQEQFYLLKLSSCYIETVDSQNACGTFTWIDGLTYTSSNNTATHTVSNVFNCDSIITLNLDLQPIDLSILSLGQVIGSNQTNADYQWLNCDDNYSIIPGEIQSTFTSNTYGNFALELTYNGCVDTSACTTINTIGIAHVDFMSSVHVSPNPTSDLVGIHFGNLQDKSVKVINTLGQIVYQKEHIVESVYQFNLSQPSGIYIIEVYSNNRRKRFKLIKK